MIGRAPAMMRYVRDTTMSSGRLANDAASAWNVRIPRLRSSRLETRLAKQTADGRRTYEESLGDDARDAIEDDERFGIEQRATGPLATENDLAPEHRDARTGIEVYHRPAELATTPRQVTDGDGLVRPGLQQIGHRPVRPREHSRQRVERGELAE